MEMTAVRTFLGNAAKAKIRHEVIDGVKYTVVPTAMITEGIHNGSAGPIFYSGDDLASAVVSWNNKPVVVFHPKKGKNGVATAADPEVLRKMRVGFLLNTQWDEKTKKLRAEVWIDEVKADKVDPRIMKTVRKGQPMEVSTGLSCEVIQNDGVHNGQAYKKVAKSHQPDHLALLPEGVGACSLAAGAGLLVTNEDGDWTGDPESPETVNSLLFDQWMQDFTENTAELVVNGMSYMDLSSAVIDALRQKMGEPGKSWYGYVVDLYDSQVIFSTGDGGTFSCGYSVDGQTVKLTGDPVPVRRISKYADMKTGKLIGNFDPFLEATSMDRSKHIAALIGNGWTEADRPELEKLPDSVLEKIKPQAAPAPAPVAPTPVANAEMTLEEYLQTVPKAFRTVVVNGLNAEVEKRTGLITRITNASTNKMTKEALEALETRVLEGMASLLPPEAPASGSGLSPEALNYFGAQGGHLVGNRGRADANVPTLVPPETFHKVAGKKQ